MSRRPSEATRFQAKVANDSGIVRGKIPSPLLRQMGARPGNYITFELAESGEATMRLARSKGTRKSTKAGRGRATERG